ncbi:hypothetical protein CMV_007116 [Castanea mollissima]|uniref:Uncharacterized protein n=1 Tax=Castanea mollissima TaxID=60419 RepID=A0A8J4W332_9ROSI|nr:hypothetical protein CMV_007116 [Castanea mollissima]
MTQPIKKEGKEMHALPLFLSLLRFRLHSSNLATECKLYCLVVTFNRIKIRSCKQEHIFITNALVKPIPTKLRLVDQYSFDPFDEFHKYINFDDPIDVIALAIAVQQPRQLQTRSGPLTIQEFALIDQLASRNEKLLEDIIAKTLDPASSSSTSILPPIENLTDIGANATSPKMVNF